MKRSGTFYAGSFPQRIRTFYSAENGLPCGQITALSYDAGGNLYAGTPEGLYMLTDKGFKKTAISGKINLLYQCSCGKLWAGSGDMIYAIKDGKVICSEQLPSPAVKLDEDDSNLWLVTADKVFIYKDGKFSYYTDIEYGNVTDMTVFGEGRLYVVNTLGVLAMHGKRPHWGLLSDLTCDMPKCRVNAIQSDRWGHIWLGTDNGILLYDSYGKWYTAKNMPHLTKGNILTLLLSDDGVRYIGTDYGLVIQDGVRESCLSAKRWIPDSEITCVAVNKDGSEVWVGTKSGLSRITTKEMTLSEKADRFEEVLDKYYEREGYFTHLLLDKPGDMESAHVEITDNDGMWTGVYLATQAYRYAVTKSEDARENARRAYKAMLKLEKVTGIHGFTARAYRRPGEEGYGDGDIEWHHVTDEKGDLEWKGETSSDEMVGHFFGMTLYYDLCADEDEKAVIAEALTAIVDHALENGYTLCDTDGRPTTWARWAPEEMNRNDMWYNERGVNSYEFLTMLRAAYHVSGDEKYINEFRHLVCDEHYALNAARHKVHDAHVTHIDDNLCFLTSITLYRYEDDPQLRQLFMLGLRHHWEYERIERAPLWNLAYGALSGDFCDLDIAVRSLEEIPMDLICYDIDCSNRPDVKWDSGQELYDGGKQLVEPLPYDENKLSNFDSNPFEPAQTRAGKYALSPTVYLLPYWFGRFHGLIGED